MASIRARSRSDGDGGPCRRARRHHRAPAEAGCANLIAGYRSRSDRRSVRAAEVSVRFRSNAMTRRQHVLVLTLIALIAVATAACVEGGIGMGVPSTGARWGSGNSGPNV